jgi:S1 RNA binding domain protein
MQLEIGKITEGKVTGITKFGAFVELEPGTSGMVHISEVANRFISDISEVLTVGQTVSVKIISVSDDGKIALSVKKAETPEAADNNPGKRLPSPPPRGNNRFASSNRSGVKAPTTFEDMMNAFKKTSDEKLGDIKRQGDKRGGRR